MALALGALLYWSAGHEPVRHIAGGLAVAFVLGAAAVYRRSNGGAALCIGVALVLGGFEIAQWRTFSVAAPQLADGRGAFDIAGTVRTIERLPQAPRLVIDVASIRQLDPGETPARIRVTVRTALPPSLLPGDPVTLRAVLQPLPRRTHPDGFDFRRWFWFRQIGATGFAISPVTRNTSQVLEEKPFHYMARQALERLRTVIGARIRAVLDGQPGAIAVALITGDRSGIDEETGRVMRDAGLAHLLAISGLHLGLVSMTVFALIRLAAALVEPVALRLPVKKWAAVFALAAGLFYLLISGAPVPTQRAFLMTGLVLLAVLLDRQAISMRLVAIAAAVVILLAPEVVTGPSFQLSFAAVIALIAAYEAFAARSRRGNREGRSLAGRLTRYFGGVAMTSIIASAATTPFVLYHFGRVALFGLVANLVAVPLMAVLVMPAGLFALVLMPFGLEYPALLAMGAGVDIVLETAHAAASLPFAHVALPLLSAAAITVYAAGFLWLCLWRRRWRFAGLAAMAAGLFLIGPPEPPDILIAEDGALMAVRDPERGTFQYAAHTSGQPFLQSVWNQAYAAGEEGEVSQWPAAGMACDAFGCVLRRAGAVVAFPADPRAVAEDCDRSGIVISELVVPASICGTTAVYDFLALRRDGTHALWLRDGSVRVETVADREERPWHGWPPPNR